ANGHRRKHHEEAGQNRPAALKQYLPIVQQMRRFLGRHVQQLFLLNALRTRRAKRLQLDCSALFDFVHCAPYPNRSECAITSDANAYRLPAENEGRASGVSFAPDLTDLAVWCSRLR